jgi:TonB-linked SusC/RagA family outer membrane protein
MTFSRTRQADKLNLFKELNSFKNMKSELLRTIMFLSKNMFYIFLFQVVSLQLLLAGNTSGQSLKEVDVTIHLSKATLKEVFEEIEMKTQFSFVYDLAILERSRFFSISEENSSMEEILTRLAEEGNLQFQRINNSIYVKEAPKRIKKEERVLEMDKRLTGKLTDRETGEPLIGATVQVKGTTIGTVTNVMGEWALSAPDEANTLVVSYIGFESAEITIGSASYFELSLVPDTQTLGEVVVYGYGTGTKEKFNGAVSNIGNEQLNNYSSANFEQSIAGALAGVQIVGNSKNPGDNSVIQIRGVNTLTAGTSPLIVVDGNPLTEGSSFSSVNTNDIESVSVLKDAASAAIYGSRASNGVILITTKKGKSNDGLNVTYDGYFGVQQRIDKFELTDAYSTALFDYDARNFGYVSGGTGRSISDDNATRDANGGGKRSRIPTYLQDYVDGVPGLTNTDWSDAVFRNASQQSHHVNLSGGTDNTNYSVSFGYFDQENIIIDSDYERFTNNIRFNSQVNDRIRFGINTNVSFSNSNPTGDTGWSRSEEGRGRQFDPAFTIVLMQPYYPIYNPDGSFAIAAQIDDNNENWDGPISENIVAQSGLSDFTRNSFRVFGSTYLEFEPVENLTFKTSFGGDYNTGLEEYFGPSIYGNYRTPVANNPTRAAKRTSERKNFITENLLNYKQTFDAHTFDVLLGYSYQEESREGIDLTSRDFADDNLRNISGATTIASSASGSKWALESYFSRVQYDFDDRYALSASLRRDGSSRFGKNTKYGDFASVSAGWTLSNEQFFPANDWVSFAKLRASWGQTGNNQIGDFASIALISNDNYVIDGGLTSGSFTSTSPNADLSWETNSALNYGLDLGFLNDKLLLSMEYYDSRTKDLLLDVPVPQQSGFSESLQNIGELKNTGFELELQGRDFSVGDISFGFNANFFTNDNEVLALGAGQDQIISNNGVSFITRIGHPIAQFYNYQITGVYRSQSEIDNSAATPLASTEVGDYIVLDANGDGVITPDDRVMLGDFNPDFTYGFGLRLAYKGFDLNAQFYGIEGRKVSDNMVNRSESGEGFFVPTQYYFDNYYNERNPDGFFRRPDFSSFSSAGRLTRASNLSILDADYFRLRSLTIGYNLPVKLTQYVGAENVRVYMAANNLFNVTDYRGYNPDGIDVRSNERQTLTRGYIYSTSPLTRFMSFGVNVKF